jgi:uncharacterized membrane protein
MRRLSDGCQIGDGRWGVPDTPPLRRNSHALRAALWVLIGCIAVLAAALALQHAVVPNIMPVSWNQEPQPTWGLELAFMLRAIENIVAMIAFLVVLFIIVTWLNRRFRGGAELP